MLLIVGAKKDTLCSGVITDKVPCCCNKPSHMLLSASLQTSLEHTCILEVEGEAELERGRELSEVEKKHKRLTELGKINVN